MSDDHKPIKDNDLSQVKENFNKNNVNKPDDDGVSPLMNAILHSSSKIVDYLINECKADIYYIDNDNNNLFHYLSARRFKLYSNDDFDFIKDDFIKIISLLRSKNVDINHINRYKQTPLCTLCFRPYGCDYDEKNIDMLIILYLEYGSNPNTIIDEDSKFTILMHNILTYSLTLFKLCIKYCTNLNQCLNHRDIYGTTPRLLIKTLIDSCENTQNKKEIWGEMLEIIDEKCHHN